MTQIRKELSKDITESEIEYLVQNTNIINVLIGYLKMNGGISNDLLNYMKLESAWILTNIAYVDHKSLEMLFDSNLNLNFT